MPSPARILILIPSYPMARPLCYRWPFLFFCGLQRRPSWLHQFELGMFVNCMCLAWPILLINCAKESAPLQDSWTVVLFCLYFHDNRFAGSIHSSKGWIITRKCGLSASLFDHWSIHNPLDRSPGPFFLILPYKFDPCLNVSCSFQFFKLILAKDS